MDPKSISAFPVPGWKDDADFNGMTPTPTSGAAGLPEALRSIQRYEVVDCINDKHVPAVIPKPHGPWVRYEDHIAALAAGQAIAAQAVVLPNAITASVMRDDGGEAPAFCLMAAYRSEKDAMDAFAMIAAAAQQVAVPSDAMRDAMRYRKLRGWMSGNVKESWREVENMGALCAWESCDAMDEYLDSLSECNLGLMGKTPQQAALESTK